MSVVLVTGGAGYIGSVVARTLLARGHRVVVLDNLSEGHGAAVPEKAVFIQGDLGDQGRLEEIFRAQAIEAVMHLAAFRNRIEHILEANGAYINSVKNLGHAQKNQDISFNTIQPYGKGALKGLYPTIEIQP